ncbi:MAG: hypothetical protein EWV48_13635 [Microcystis aeruginosa Ma_QC_C_20070823_S13]|nr:MAG: hypothetical protein EWV48_13635 [Microcystis aeruginosa Ma_QC_C_20070823_S13]TRU64141.1 MAG: hypothetical protein EWV56_03660 [Microcystis aeruginosa Ma_QC_C_20070823_S13D]
MPSADFFTDVVMLLNIEDRFFNLLQEIITIIVCWVSLRQSNLQAANFSQGIKLANFYLSQ